MSSVRLYVYSLLVRLLPESSGFGIKSAILRWAGAKVGTNVRVYSSAHILGVGGLVIGDDVHIGPGVRICPNRPATVTIGSHVDIGPDVLILTGSHEIDPVGEHTAGKGTAASVSVADGCWLGARSTILPGVALPRKTLVAAGAVVTKTPPGRGGRGAPLLAGVPAAVKRALGEKGEKGGRRDAE